MSLMNRSVVQPNLVAQFQQQGKGVLGNGICPVAGHIGHRDAPLSGGSQVNPIVARCLYPDVSNAGALLQKTAGDGRFVGQHNFGISNAGSCLCLGIRTGVHGVSAEFPQPIPAQVAGVQSSAV